MNFWGVRKARGQYKKHGVESCPHLWVKEKELIEGTNEVLCVCECGQEIIREKKETK